MEITLRLEGEKPKEQKAMCLVYGVHFPSKGIKVPNIGQSQLSSIPLICFLLLQWMQDNLKDITSSLLSCQSETFNKIPSREKKKLSSMCKNELPFTVTSYSILRMNFTQVEI